MLKASRDHLDEVEETYFAHLRAALAITGLLAKAGIACAVHAIVPGLCTRTASRCIARLSSNLNRRGIAVELQPPYKVTPRALSSELARVP